MARPLGLDTPSVWEKTFKVGVSTSPQIWVWSMLGEDNHTEGAPISQPAH